MNERAQFELGIGHFNAGEFFEAHEVWEEIWLEAPESEKPFLQGLIQIAAAFHHYHRANLSGTKSLLAAGIAKLRAFSGHHCGVDLNRLLGDLHDWSEAIQQMTAVPPKIRFIGET